MSAEIEAHSPTSRFDIAYHAREPDEERTSQAHRTADVRMARTLPQPSLPHPVDAPWPPALAGRVPSPLVACDA